MALPALYKFMDRRGAKLTLGNGTLRHAKPSSFNDLEELTVQSLFSEELAHALEIIARSMPDVIQQNLHRAPTCPPPLNLMIQTIQNAFRDNPDAAAMIKAELEKEEIHDLGTFRTSVDTFMSEINQIMQDHRILCVTPLIASPRMWERYAENDHGIALRIEGNLSKDSKFQLFHPVNYAPSRPPLYGDTIQFIEDSFFGDRRAILKEKMEQIVYTKTKEWEYEQEFRLSIPTGDGDDDWDTLPYHPEEITEIHLGKSMPEADKREIVSLAKRRNPAILIFQAT